MSLKAFTELLTAIQHALHPLKMLIFELMLFGWALVEISKFFWGVVMGGHGG